MNAKPMCVVKMDKAGFRNDNQRETNKIFYVGFN